jgi:hypothetical protein
MMNAMTHNLRVLRAVAISIVFATITFSIYHVLERKGHASPPAGGNSRLENSPTTINTDIGPIEVHQSGTRHGESRPAPTTAGSPPFDESTSTP